MINFKKYDEENPDIWNMFVIYANKAKDKGFDKYSANGIFELIRWHTTVRGTEGYKISNNYRPDYARKMMEVHPEFKGFFRVKALSAERK